jgi:hypothetical protein
VYALNVAIKVLQDTLYLATNSSGKASWFTALHTSVAIFGDPPPFNIAAPAIRPLFLESSLRLRPAPFFASLDLQRHYESF